MNCFDYAKNWEKCQPKMGINTVLFDLGNTLMYYDAPWPESFITAGKALLDVLRPEIKTVLDEKAVLDSLLKRIQEYPDPSDGYRQKTSLEVMKTVLQESGLPQLPEPILREGLKAMFTEAERHWQPEDDSMPVLTELHDRGYRLAVVSNAMDDDNIQRLVDKCGIRHLLRVVISSAAFGYAKPNPGIFRFALEHCGSLPEETVMVGDSLEFDVAGAHGLGMRSIWITRRVRKWEEKKAGAIIQPDAVVATLKEVSAAMKEW